MYCKENGGKLDIYYKRKEIQENDVMAPVVVYVHGGAWIMGKKEHVPPLVQWLASRGIVTVSVDYRLAPKVFVICYLYLCILYLFLHLECISFSYN